MQRNFRVSTLVWNDASQGTVSLLAATLRSYYQPVKAALVEVRLPDRIPHDVKRTARRRFDRGGMSEALAMRVMGLRTTDMSRRHNITTDEDGREGLRRLYEVEAERKGKAAHR